jgi:hypothetical protein
MALDALVIARYGGASSQYLANLTQNFDSNGPGSVDTVVLGLACDDVKGDFEMEAGVVYNDDPVTNPDSYKSHISVGVQCVIIKLQLWTGKTPDKFAKQLLDRYDKLLERLGQITSRDRFLVESSSPFEESDQTNGGDPILPPFDDDLMRFFIPDAGVNLGGQSDRRVNLP